MAAMALRRQPRRDGDGASADAGFPLGTVPRLPADAGFFLDIDGTLLDIAERPQLVRIDDDLGHLLAMLRDASGGAASTAPSAATPLAKCTSTASRLPDFERR